MIPTTNLTAFLDRNRTAKAQTAPGNRTAASSTRKTSRGGRFAIARNAPLNREMTADDGDPDRRCSKVVPPARRRQNLILFPPFSGCGRPLWAPTSGIRAYDRADEQLPRLLAPGHTQAIGDLEFLKQLELRFRGSGSTGRQADGSAGVPQANRKTNGSATFRRPGGNDNKFYRNPAHARA